MRDEIPNDNRTFRRSDVVTLTIFVCSIFAFFVIGVLSALVAFGSGLASTPETPVSTVANVMWACSGLSFIPGLVLLAIALITRERLYALLLGTLILVAIALLAGGMVWDTRGTNDVLPPSLAYLLIPLVPGVVVLLMATRFDPLGTDVR